MKSLFLLLLLAFEPVCGTALFAAAADANVDVGTGPDESTLLPPVKLTTFHVKSLITSRYVSTTVDATYVNTADVSQEVTFVYEITPTSYISGFSIDVDGILYPAEIMEKEAARTAFKDAKKRGQSAGYAKEGGNPLKFSVALNVAQNSTVIFHFSYVDLLRRDEGIYTHRLNIAPGQVVEDLKVEAFIMDQQGITELTSFWIPRADGLQSSVDSQFQKGMEKANVTFTPSVSQQENVDPSSGIDGDFVMRYGLKSQPTEGNLQVNGGYFAHFISPEDLPAAPKKVVFVIDVSGSMGDGKLQQTKVALKAILAQLRDSDVFNLMVFSTMVSRWLDQPVQVSEDSIGQAIIFVESLSASGGTNIHDALVTAAGEFVKGEPFFPAIIFMTDGIPSSGVTDSDVIIRDVTEAIDAKAALYSVGFGNDVDELMLKRLSASNRGFYQKVANDENAARQMEGFFQEVATPLLYNIRVVYDSDAVPTETLTQNEFISFFDGKELIIAGKLDREFDGPALSGTMTAVSAEGQIEIPFGQDISEMAPMPNVVEDYTERIWVYLTVKELLIKEQLVNKPSQKVVLRERAVALSIRYHLVTPVTALVFYLPVQEEPEPLVDIKDGAPGELPEPIELTLPVGIYETSEASVFGDPHFLINIPGTNLTICFDVHGDEGTVVNLVTDPVLDMVVNAKMALFSMDGGKGGNGTRNTLFNRIGVRLGHHEVVIAPLQVFVDFEVSYTWRKPRIITLDKYTLEIKEKGQVVISLGSGIVINIQRLLWKNHPTHFDFFLTQGAGFSDRVHGIVGQFHRKSMRIIDASRRTKTGVVQGTMFLNEKEEAIVYHRKNFSRRGYECWWAKADAYLDGRTDQYQVATLFDRMSQLFV